jgi:hypothetical protein
MSRFSSALRRSQTARAGRRTDRAIARALAAAPTIESAHEIATIAQRR